MKHLFLLFVVYAGGLRYEDRNNDVFSFFLFFIFFSQPWPWLLDKRGRREIAGITIEQRTVDLSRLFIRDFDEFRGKWLEVKSPWNLWAVHVHCDVITTSGVPFASKYSRLTRDCSMVGNKRTRKRACRCCNMERDFFLFVCFFASLSLSFSFRRNKRILEEGWWFKNAGITRVGGQTVFAHAKQRVNFEEYLFSVFVDIILYTCYFQTRVLNFLKRIE